MPLTVIAKECLEAIKAGGGWVFVEKGDEGVSRYFPGNGGFPLPWGVVRSLILSGHLEPNDDGLLQEFPQTYRVTDPEGSKAHA